MVTAGSAEWTRRTLLGALGATALTGVAGSLLGGCGDDEQGSTTGASPGGNGGERHNILLIVADDMRFDHLQFVPKVSELLGAGGTTFTQARCNVPLCQPMRVGLFTGQTSRHNGERAVGFRGSVLQDHDNCVARWMRDADYRCALIGKYLNFWDGIGGIRPPSGYHTWRELVKESAAYDFEVRDNERVLHITDRYPTEYLRDEALAFIEAVREPFLCIVTPTQPHAPHRARTDLEDAFADYEWPLVDEEDVSDKPPWIQALAPLTEEDKATIRNTVVGVRRELAAVDDMVADILDGIDDDVLSRTVVMFTSDNGVHHGEHRRRGEGTKSGPYEVALRVPLLVRGPGFEAGATVDAPCMIAQDLTATMLHYAGATAGLPNQGGTPITALRDDPDAHAERMLLHEIGRGFHGQSGDGITTGPASGLGFRKLYRYPAVRDNPSGPFTYEAYDLDTDPDEFANWADDPARRAERDVLEQHLDELLRA